MLLKTIAGTLLQGILDRDGMMTGNHTILGNEEIILPVKTTQIVRSIWIEIKKITDPPVVVAAEVVAGLDHLTLQELDNQTKS